MRRLLSTLILLTLAGILVPAASASAASPPASPSAGSPSAGQPSQGRFGVRLYDVPVIDAHNPRGLQYIVDFLPSGTVIHRRIQVSNLESHTAHFTVYPDTAKIAHGKFLADTGHTRSELTSWITVQHPSLTIGPHGHALDKITIRVPKTATRGEHYGVIWVQQTARAGASHRFAVKEVSKVGIRIYLAVGHGGAPPTKFVITAMTGHRSASGQPLLTTRVRNDGGRAIDLTGRARLSHGPAGITAGPFQEQRVITLAPGQTGNVRFAPGKSLPDGPWQATVKLTSGFTSATARGTVQFSESQAAGAGIHSPLMIAGAAILALVILGLVFVLIRRARPARRMRA